MLREVWRRFVRRHIADDVPDEMVACLDCGETECSEERYQTCRHRLVSAESYRQAVNSIKNDGQRREPSPSVTLYQTVVSEQHAATCRRTSWRRGRGDQPGS
jgi:hypothetical protein